MIELNEATGVLYSTEPANTESFKKRQRLMLYFAKKIIHLNKKYINDMGLVILVFSLLNGVKICFGKSSQLSLSKMKGMLNRKFFSCTVLNDESHQNFTPFTNPYKVNSLFTLVHQHHILYD